MPRKRHSESAEDVLTLKLRENHFVSGVFCKAGTLITLPRDQANKELATTRLWDVV